MALKPKIQALIDYANETTGAGDVTLGECVKTLAEGYNGGANVPSAPLVVPSGEMSAKLASLLAYANEVTGAGDTRMGDCIKTLCDGYGKGEEPIKGYLDFRKNCVFDLGIIPQVDYRYELDVHPYATSGSNANDILAYRYNASTDDTSVMITADDSSGGRHNFSAKNVGYKDELFKGNTIVGRRMTIVMDGRNVIVEGNEYTLSTTIAWNLEHRANLFLGGRRYYNGTYSQAGTWYNGRFYRLVIKNGSGNVVYDFVGHTGGNLLERLSGNIISPARGSVSFVEDIN